jgi:hypothetical protein
MSFGVSTTSINSASNGLNVTNGVVKLGGTLNTQVTEIEIGLGNQIQFVGQTNQFILDDNAEPKDANGLGYTTLRDLGEVVVSTNDTIQLRNSITGDTYNIAVEKL